MSDWQPIETAPKKGRPFTRINEFLPDEPTIGDVVLLVIPFDPPVVSVGWWSPEAGCFRYLDDDGPNDIEPTHWMPLPAWPRAAPVVTDEMVERACRAWFGPRLRWNNADRAEMRAALLAALEGMNTPEGANADTIGFLSIDPDDRFYHAADRTWWSRDANGRLRRAEPPAALEGRDGN